MKSVPSLAALACLVPLAATSVAAVARIGPIIDLPLAAVVGALDPALTSEERRDLATLANGGAVARHAPIEVTADAITCRESDVAIGERSCDLTFGAHTDFGAVKAKLTGLKAHEMDATLKEAGAKSEGAAGTVYTGLTDLRCTVSPLQILAKAGGGASCTFAPAR